MTIDKKIIDKLMKDYQSPEDIFGTDGVSYGDYVEQLTYLLFLKVGDEQSHPPFDKTSAIPKEPNWKSLLEKDGTELENHYRLLLSGLSREKGMLGVIFRKSQNRVFLL